MMNMDLRRRFFAEEIQAICNLRTTALVEALASIPRERFLPPGPWTVRGDADLGAPPRQTPDADPRHVYHNLAVAIDPARQLFNGGPSVVTSAIDALALKPGDRAVHIGTGLGYYTALMAHAVGPSGRVTGIEVDDTLARETRRNLASWPWVEVRHGNGTELIGPCEAMLVNAGVTHPLDGWLDAIVPGGRLILPLTAGMPAMGPIGKGLMLLLTKTAGGGFDVRVQNMVVIYSAIGLRDEAMNEAVGKAMMRGPFAPIKRLRRDPHDVSPACWLHGPAVCLSTTAGE